MPCPRRGFRVRVQSHENAEKDEGDLLDADICQQVSCHSYLLRFRLGSMSRDSELVFTSRHATLSRDESITATQTGLGHELVGQPNQ